MDRARLSARHVYDRLYRATLGAALGMALLVLLALLLGVVQRALPAFWQAQITLEVSFPDQDTSTTRRGMDAVLRDALSARLGHALTVGQAREFFSPGALAYVRQMLPRHAGDAVTVSLPVSEDIRTWLAGQGALERVSVTHVQALQASGFLTTKFNYRFFLASDSRDPSLAGIWGGLMGSVLTLVLAMLLALPLGVAAAVYFEEFAPRTRITLALEALMANLAAVPSIIYGLLGLAVFIGFLGLPRASALVGGLVLGIMSLPVVVIATRAALRSVPQEQRAAALALGCRPRLVIWTLTVPLALPGIMSGVILALAHAVGETAPLLLLGMVAFISQPQFSLTDPSTMLPVQIYLWAERPEAGFSHLAAAAILVLLVLVFLFNLAAILIRQKSRVRF